MIEDLTPIVEFVGFEDHDDPLQVFVDLLRRNRIGTGRLGVEKDAYFLSVRSYDALTAAFEGSVFCDASQIVEEQRLIKSAEEIACHREAGRIIVEATRAGIKSVKPGCTDGSIVTSVAGALIEAGSGICCDLAGSSDRRAVGTLARILAEHSCRKRPGDQYRNGGSRSALPHAAPPGDHLRADRRASPHRRNGAHSESCRNRCGWLRERRLALPLRRPIRSPWRTALATCSRVDLATRRVLASRPVGCNA